VLAAHDLGDIGNHVWVDGLADFDLAGEADVALHFDSGVIHNYLTLETENHVAVEFRTVGANGGDFLLA
jgi:hypothetical protein